MTNINDLRQAKSMADRLAAYLAELILAMSTSDDAPNESPLLHVPYRSQWDGDANTYNSDCGPTAVAMVVEFFGSHVAINNIAAAAHEAMHPKYTLPADLIDAARKYGVELKRTFNVTLDQLRIETMEKFNPAIVLVHYGALTSLVQDKKFVKGHWLVVIGVDAQHVYVNDPNWRDARRNEGAGLAIPVERFKQAMADCESDENTPNQALFVVRLNATPG